MLWMKAFHIIAMASWFAGLVYLPRLFVYHCQIPFSDSENYQRFCLMEKRLFRGIMTPTAIITLILGVGLVHTMKLSFSQPPLWLALKLGLVGLLVLFHIYCGWVMIQFKKGTNRHQENYYRWVNEIPTLAFIGIVLLVVLKPV